jgi:hypothetical protein
MRVYLLVLGSDDSDIYTWGQGINGRLGHGDDADQLMPKVRTRSSCGGFVSPHPASAVCDYGRLWNRCWEKVFARLPVAQATRCV